MKFDEAVAQVKEHDGHTISLKTLKDHNPKCWDAIKFLEGWNEAIEKAAAMAFATTGRTKPVEEILALKHKEPEKQI